MKKLEFDHKTGAYLEVAGASIYYEEIKNKEIEEGEPTLIFLHGGMGNIADFNPIIPLFAGEFNIVGIDSRGHGKSTLGTERLTYKRLQLDVEAVVNHLQLKRISIIGFSDGGVVAYRLALSDEIEVHAIVTLGAACDESSPVNNEEFFAKFTFATYVDWFKENFEFYERDNPQPDAEKLIKAVEAMWFDRTAEGYPYDNIGNISIHTLIVRGNDDFDPLEQYVDLVGKIGNAILFNIPFEGHVPAFERYPHFFVEVAKDFINGDFISRDD